MNRTPLMPNTRQFLFALLTLVLFSFEKDDIRVDGDSAVLVIEFRDASDKETLKPVSGLSVLLNDTAYQGIENQSVSKLELALSATQKNYVFHFDQEESALSDQLEINVTPIITYVSRACGYVLEFEGLSAQPIDPLDWISSIEVLIETVTATNEPHLVIYH